MNENVVRIARPNPMQICACAWIYRWTIQDWVTGPLGLRAAGPSRAVGRRAVESRGPLGFRAAGPLGRRGPWAAGLLLAK